MEARARDGKTTEAVAKAEAKTAPPRERLLPLKSVEFKNPVPVEGHEYPVRRLTRGEPISTNSDAVCPKIFIDPELQAIVVGDRHYPMVDVKFYVRAKAA